MSGDSRSPMADSQAREAREAREILESLRALEWLDYGPGKRWRESDWRARVARRLRVSRWTVGAWWVGTQRPNQRNLLKLRDLLAAERAVAA